MLWCFLRMAVQCAKYSVTLPVLNKLRETQWPKKQTKNVKGLGLIWNVIAVTSHLAVGRDQERWHLDHYSRPSHLFFYGKVCAEASVQKFSRLEFASSRLDYKWAPWKWRNMGFWTLQEHQQHHSRGWPTYVSRYGTTVSFPNYCQNMDFK